MAYESVKRGFERYPIYLMEANRNNPKPAYTRLLSWRAQVSYLAGDFSACITDSLTSLHLTPKNNDASIYLTAAYIQTGKVHPALNTVQALAKDTSHIYYAFLGDIEYQLLGQKEEGRKNYDITLKILQENGGPKIPFHVISGCIAEHGLIDMGAMKEGTIKDQGVTNGITVSDELIQKYLKHK